MQKIILTLVALALSSCTTTLSQKDLIDIKNIAIVNCMKDSLFLYKSGLTKLEGSSNSVDISNWKLVDRISNQVATTAKENFPDFKLTIMNRKKYPCSSDNYSSEKIALQMKDEGYDSLILITNAGMFHSSTGTDIVSSKKAGFIMWERSFFGKNPTTSISAQYQLTLIKTEGGKSLKFAGTFDIYGHPASEIRIKPYSQYTQNEKSIIEKDLISHIDTTIAKNTMEIFTVTTR